MRLKGQTLLAVRHKDAKEQAEACLRDALACAGGQRSKMLSLRAATSLAGLWNDQGRGIEARELLAPYYNSLTEGFDTPDLKQAKSLLDTL